MDPFTTPSRDETLLIFAIHGIRCAVPAQSVATIVMPPRQVAHPPGSNRTRPGIFALNGVVHGVVDLREAFGLGDGAPGGRLLLYHVGAHHYAFAVDEVVGLVRSEEGQWASLPPDLPRKTFTRGFLHQREIVLCSDFPRLLRLEDGEPLRRHFSAIVAARSPVVASHLPSDTPSPHSEPMRAVSRPSPPPAPAVAAVIPPPAQKPLAAPPAVPRPPAPRTPASIPPRPRPAVKPRPVAAHVPALPPSRSGGSISPRPKQEATVEYYTPPPPATDAIRPTAPRSWAILLLCLLSLGGGWWFWPQKITPPSPAPLATPHNAPLNTQVEAPKAVPLPETVEPLHLVKGDAGITLIVEESRFAQRSETTAMPAVPREERRILHRVRKGETLWAIAERYVHDPWRFRELARQSGIDNPDLIYPGDKVTIVIR